MDDEETEAPKPSKLKAMLPLLGVLLLGLGGGYGTSIALAPPPDDDGDAVATAAGHEPAAEAAKPAEGHGEEKPAEGHGEEKPDPAAPATKPAGAAPAVSPTVTTLGAFTVNLKGSGGGRVLRLEVAVDSDASTTQAVQMMTPQLRDSIITAVSDFTWSELEGTDGKTRLKDELLIRINGVTDPIRVDRVYLTTFVVS
ncbi:MAG: flagellar basal body-associated FliL family protein [Myxococcales bacterium]|nr:flagellar basal body-associated FliL family protein [Myxococcales bacterium]